MEKTMYVLIFYMVSTSFLLVTSAPSREYFSREPTESTYFEDHYFPCYCESRDSVLYYEWMLNDNLVTSITPNATLYTEDNLAILELLCSQEMEVMCCYVMHDLVTRRCSRPAILRVQGVPHQVSNLMAKPTSTSITLTWDPCPSPNITEAANFTLTSIKLRWSPNVNTSIFYNVEIRKGTESTFENTTNSNFTYYMSNPDPSDEFVFIVTAVNVVGRGKPSQTDPVHVRPAVVTNVTTEITTTMNINMNINLTNFQSDDNVITATSIGIAGIGIGGISLGIVAVAFYLKRHYDNLTKGMFVLSRGSGSMHSESSPSENLESPRFPGQQLNWSTHITVTGSVASTTPHAGCNLEEENDNVGPPKKLQQPDKAVSSNDSSSVTVESQGSIGGLPKIIQVQSKDGSCDRISAQPKEPSAEQESNANSISEDKPRTLAKAIPEQANSFVTQFCVENQHLRVFVETIPVEMEMGRLPSSSSDINALPVSHVNLRQASDAGCETAESYRDQLIGTTLQIAVPVMPPTSQQPIQEEVYTYIVIRVKIEFLLELKDYIQWKFP